MRHVLFLLAPLALGTSHAQATDHRFQFNQIVSAYAQADHFMGSVTVMVDGKEIYSRATGSASLEQGVPNRLNTVFEAGSITKSFTAVAVLKLQEQGKLRVSDPLSKFLPDYPNAGHITLDQLLTHTSGVASVTALPNFVELQKQNLTPDQIIGLFKNLPASFAPGERYEYSNSGYILLGKVIEVASGQTYPEYVQQNVLDALGYKASGMYSGLDLIPARAGGYVLDGASFRLPEAHNVEFAGAAGRLFTTSRELARWLPGVLNGKVLSGPGVKAFVTPRVETHEGTDESRFYGYGVEVGTMLGHDVVSHGGNINGFNSMMFYFPAEKLSVVALSNTEGVSSVALTKDLIKAYFGAPYTLRKARPVVSVPEAVLNTYVGSYKLEGIPVVLDVSLGGGQLTIKMPGEGTYKLLPYDQRSFVLTAVGGEVKFQPGTSGMDLVLSLAGQNLVAHKQP